MKLNLQDIEEIGDPRAIAVYTVLAAFARGRKVAVATRPEIAAAMGYRNAKSVDGPIARLVEVGKVEVTPVPVDRKKCTTHINQYKLL